MKTIAGGCVPTDTVISTCVLVVSWLVRIVCSFFLCGHVYQRFDSLDRDKSLCISLCISLWEPNVMATARVQLRLSMKHHHSHASL